MDTTLRRLAVALGATGILALMLLPGRAAEPAPGTGESKPPAVKEESPGANGSKGDAKPIAVIGSWADVQKRVAAAKGKVVVVNVWTTTCATCREEFPAFVALRKLPEAESRLALISVACDYDGIAEKPPEFYRPRVDGFLRESKGADLDNVLLNRAFVDFLEDVELKSTPAFYVYSAKGGLVRRFDNDDAATEKDEFTMEQVRQLVQTHLGLR